MKWDFSHSYRIQFEKILNLHDVIGINILSLLRRRRKSLFILCSWEYHDKPQAMFAIFSDENTLIPSWAAWGSAWLFVMNHSFPTFSKTSYANVIKFDSIEFALILRHVFFNCSGYDFDVSLLATMTNCCFDTRYLRVKCSLLRIRKYQKKQNTFHLTRTWLKFEIFPIFFTSWVAAAGSRSGNSLFAQVSDVSNFSFLFLSEFSFD